MSLTKGIGGRRISLKQLKSLCKMIKDLGQGRYVYRGSSFPSCHVMLYIMMAIGVSLVSAGRGNDNVYSFIIWDSLPQLSIDR